MRVKRRYKIIGAIVIIMIIVANINPVNALLKMSVDAEHYSYSNASGTATFMEDFYKGRKIGKLEEFRVINPICIVPGFENDTLMYRLYAKNVLAFWRWKSYFTDYRYELPYADWKEIATRRKSYIDTLPHVPCLDF